jgi:NADH:ubiquinone oxidoreductase subunit 6 (subunit J)
VFFIALVTFVYFIIDPKNNIIYEQIDYNQPLLILIAYFFLTILVFTTIVYGIIKFNKSGDYKKVYEIISDFINKIGK